MSHHHCQPDPTLKKLHNYSYQTHILYIHRHTQSTYIVGDSTRIEERSEDDNSYIQQSRSGYLQANAKDPRNVTVLRETEEQNHFL